MTCYTNFSVLGRRFFSSKSRRFLYLLLSSFYCFLLSLPSRFHSILHSHYPFSFHLKRTLYLSTDFRVLGPLLLSDFPALYIYCALHKRPLLGFICLELIHIFFFFWGCGNIDLGWNSLSFFLPSKSKR